MRFLSVVRSGKEASPPCVVILRRAAIADSEHCQSNAEWAAILQRLRLQNRRTTSSRPMPSVAALHPSPTQSPSRPRHLRRPLRRPSAQSLNETSPYRRRYKAWTISTLTSRSKALILTTTLWTMRSPRQLLAPPRRPKRLASSRLLDPRLRRHRAGEPLLLVQSEPNPRKQAGSPRFRRTPTLPFTPSRRTSSPPLRRLFPLSRAGLPFCPHQRRPRMGRRSRTRSRLS